MSRRARVVAELSDTCDCAAHPHVKNEVVNKFVSAWLPPQFSQNVKSCRQIFEELVPGTRGEGDVTRPAKTAKERMAPQTPTRGVFLLPVPATFAQYAYAVSTSMP